MKPRKIMGIGNAIVDALQPVEDDFLIRMKIDKGVMQLIDQDRAESLYWEMVAPRQSPGGSVANTIAGIGALGLETAFIGRVRDDELGYFYAQAMEQDGIAFLNPPAPDGELPTSRSMIFVSPDGERSMNTYLGISAEFGPEDVPDDIGGKADFLFLEGYLYDKPKGKAAFGKAARLIRDGGGKAGIALSDPFCVERHRDSFRQLVRELDYVIGNEHEWMSLYQCDLETALEQAARESGMVVCTRSGKDVILIHDDRHERIHVNPIVPVDATGAGDQFAAGFLYGLAAGAPLDIAGRMGCVAASEVISHFGARPERDVRELFRQEKLI